MSGPRHLNRAGSIETKDRRLVDLLERVRLRLDRAWKNEGKGSREGRYTPPRNDLQHKRET